MYSLRDKYYRFGSTVLKLISPAFTENDQFRKFIASPSNADLIVRIDPVNIPRLPSGESRHDFYTNADWYSTDKGETAVIRDLSGRVLWTAEYHTDGSVAAEFNVSSGISLTSFVIAEIIDLPRLLLSRNSLVLHSSFIEYEGDAILFTAPKQTGKSTQAELWRHNAGANVINGDRALIENRGGVYYACGLPYSGTSGICNNASHPVRAVIILSQGKSNNIRPATISEALRALMSGCSFDGASANSVNAFMPVAESVAVGVPFYSMECLPEPSAVDELRRILF